MHILRFYFFKLKYLCKGRHMNMPVLFVEFIHLFFLQSIFLCASHRT